MGPEAVGCKDNTLGHGGMEKKEILSSGGEKTLVCVEDEMSIHVEEREVGPIDTVESVNITRGP
ncbi:Hypothetical predicted protein [Olea europaea subsp. europaea]|uniref:Uncharacterized protein n=1 Tax=Olea europaea subsp. europaea TaxID=158383 RepID=A0A8S0RG50_OLEEU|nr:Hypothetical predicted protein [Olea europaea subsp. europaea]